MLVPSAPGRILPTVTVGGWYRPHQRGAAFLATHAFVSATKEESPPIVGSCLLRLLFVYTAHCCCTHNVEGEGGHFITGGTAPRFPTLVHRVRLRA